MFNIGIINDDISENELQLNMNNLNFDYFVTEYIKPQFIDSEVDNMDAVLIYTTNCDSSIAKICQYIMDIKNSSDSLIWIVSKSHAERTNIIYLQLGADGIIDTNLSEKEIELFMKNALNRKKKVVKEVFIGKRPVKKQEMISSIRLNENNLSFVCSDGEIQLTRIEYKLFQLLLTNPGVAFSYEDLYKYVWDKPFNNQKYRVSNVVFHLRKKLEEFSLNPDHIKTVHSVGYMIRE